MAEKVRKKERKKRKKEEKHFSRQLEEKWVGTRTEVFARIQAKEAEIRKKTQEERLKADRIIEDAKGEAAAIKRKATLEEIGKEEYERIIEAARKEAEEIEKSTAREVAAVEKEGGGNLEKAVEFIVHAVLSTPYTPE
jgi:hypothetical protein